MSILGSGRNDETSPGDYADEMTPFDRLDDSAMDALASGRVPPGRDDLTDMAEFAAALMDAVVASPQPSPELAALLVKGLSPAELDAVASPSSAGRQLNRRKRTLPETALAKLASLGLAAKASVAVAALLAATTGAGAAGALPDPVQKTVANVVSMVSPFAIPRPDETAARADAGAPADANVSTDGDPEGDDSHAVSDTARTTDAEGCERRHEVAEITGGDPVDCVTRGSVGPAEAPADPGLDTAAGQAADKGQPHPDAAAEGQPHPDAAADASQPGRVDNPKAPHRTTNGKGHMTDKMPPVPEQQGKQADDARQRGNDAADAGVDNAADSRP